jgi:hypothetical protein
MSPELVVVLSGTLTFGVPLVVAVREVIVTRRGGGWRPPPRPRAPNADAPRRRVLEDA